MTEDAIDRINKDQPSIRMNKSNLNGSEMITGGSTIIPIPSRMLATMTSMTKNGNVYLHPDDECSLRASERTKEAQQSEKEYHPVILAESLDRFQASCPNRRGSILKHKVAHWTTCHLDRFNGFNLTI